MNAKSKSFLAWRAVFLLGALLSTTNVLAQCDLGTEAQIATADMTHDAGAGIFAYTDQGDGEDVYAGFPVAGDCGALVSLTTAWTASIHASLAGRTLLATADEEPYLDVGLFLVANGDSSGFANEVYVAFEQLNYTGHSDDSDVYGVAALFEAVKNNENIPTTAVGGARRSSEGTSYLAFSSGTQNQPVAESLEAVSGVLTLSYNPANKMLTASYNGRAFGQISLGAFGANPTLTLYVAGTSGGGAVIDDGTAEADSLRVSVPPPAFTVTAPANNAAVATAPPPVVTSRGTFKDANGLSGIWCAVNGATNDAIEVDTLLVAGADPSTAPKSGNWSGSLDLSQAPAAAPGKNTLTFWAVNTKGVSSTPISRTVNWSLTTKLALSVSPSSVAGKLRGLANNQTVVAGKSYMVTAVPNSGWAFWKWTDGDGNILATNETYDFAPNVAPANADQGVALTASFIANPYPLVAGTYDGLFSVMNDLTVTNAGYLSITVTKTGAYSGSVMFGSRVARSMAGQFDLASQFETGDPTATASAVIVLNKTNALGLSMTLNGLTNGVPAALNGVINLYNIPEKRFVWPNSALMDVKPVALKNPAPTGLYNFVLPPVSAHPAQGPSGWSLGAATVGKTGGVTVVLTLADGVTPVTSLGTGVAADGSFPIYLPLYGGQGLLFGWMQFTNDASQAQFNGATLDLESTNLSWFANTEKHYPTGFASDASSFFVFGSRYVAPKAGTNIFGFTSLTFQIDMQLNDMFAAALGFNPKTEALSVTGPNASHLALHFNSSTGVVTGSEVIGGKPISIKETLLPPLSAAYGFYIGNGKTDVATGQSGPVWIYGAAAVPGDR